MYLASAHTVKNFLFSQHTVKNKLILSAFPKKKEAKMGEGSNVPHYIS